MYPIIFSYKFITIGTYGVMLASAFYLGLLLGEREFKAKGINPELAYKLIVAIIPSAIIGAKIFHILDYFDDFLKNPWEMIFSGSGLSVLGGFTLALLVSIIIIKKNKENAWKVLDVAALSLSLGYGVGRFGCHISGDGCYGITTSSFLGMAFPNGIVPTTAEVFPTPLFESLASLLLLVFLLELRKKNHFPGFIFIVYLFFYSLSRFLVEFIRRNPKIWLNLSQAQLVSFTFFILSLLGFIYLQKKALKKGAD